MCQMFWRVGISIPRLFRILYVVNCLVVVRFNSSSPWSFFVEVAFIIGCKLVVFNEKR
jgi:hypothetical protein